MTKYVHLRCHTNYSIGEGSIFIDSLVDLCINNSYSAIAMVDTNNMFGAREFSYKLATSGIQPIIGYQLIVSYENTEGYLVLLAKSEIGYKNLLKLHDIAYQNKAMKNLDLPKVDFSDLITYSKDIVCLSGGIDGLLSLLVDTLNIESFITNLKLAFSSDFYIELNRFHTDNDLSLEDKFLNIALRYNIPIVATNNVFFTAIEDYESADILFCIGQGVSIYDRDRKKLIREAYFKTANEMIELFKDLPEALENTINIAKKCCFYVKKKDLALPKFSDNEDKLIIDEAKEGLEVRLEREVYKRLTTKNISRADIKQRYEERLNFELEVIIRMGFCGYFLIVSDFIRWAKNNDIPVGPGRGSGAGSLVAWCLQITDVDPIQFNLLFERFLNPERISMPDFDIDFCQNGRDKVVTYVRDKYGQDRVAHIITFGTLQAKAAIKDVGRVTGLSYSEVDSVTKKIPYSAPSNPITMSKLVSEEGPIMDEINSKPHIKTLLNHALKLEGLYRNTSTHAAGVVIAKEPLNEIVPLYYDSEVGLPSVGFSMKYIEDIGLVKFDFLALTTLTIINDACKRIKKNEHIDIDILNIPYTDVKISNLLSSGSTLGVFQLESRGMTEVIKQFKPDKIEDIIAIISLYRPGPMENIPLYIGNKFNIDKVSYQHPKMLAILEETFGIMIYQEQVMQVAQVIGGYTLGAADILRRAMGKKDPVEMEKQRSIFIDGAITTNAISKELASDIFNQMEKFAGYGFNKSHATAYAIISWQTAYLKAYYSVEFLVASMSAHLFSSNKDSQKFLEYIEEAKKYNIDILPPNINHPTLDFEIELKNTDQKAIRYSLLALKGMGHSFVESIIQDIQKNGRYKSLENFLERVDPKVLNKKQLEALIKAGALDDLYENRKELLHNIDALLNYNSNIYEFKNTAQINLFGDAMEDSLDHLKINSCGDWTVQEKRAEELDIVGYFLSGHPLNEYADILKKQQVISYTDLIENKLNIAFLAGYLMKIKVSKSKNGSMFANLSFYDNASVFNIVLFADNFFKFKDIIEEGKIYIIKVTTKIDTEEVRVFIDNIYELNSSYKIKSLPKKAEIINKTSPRVDSLQQENLVLSFMSIEEFENFASNISTSVNKAKLKIHNGKEYLVFQL